MCIGIVALLTGRTGEIITISCFGALSLYILGMLSLLMLRRKEPELERPFKVPFYPYFPLIALVIAIVALVAMITLNINLSLIYFSLLVLGYFYFKFFTKRTDDAQSTIAA
jgi:ethanolamine permease